jgi:hypothetical protein
MNTVSMMTRLVQVEVGLLAVVLLAARYFPRFGSRVFRALERALVWLGRRRALSVLLVGVVALAARLAIAPLLPVHAPAAHDEFSYLLAGDTFASGRLTNPPHPLWQSFETFHVIQQPTYASMYPVMQGLVLATGQFFFHNPMVGVWLSVAVLCAAICWMLQGWLPPAWALLGGVLAIIRFGLTSHWATTGWGGAHAGVAGALVLGAFPRLLRRQRAGHALLLALGLLILANSRPYEGLMFSLPVVAVLLARLLPAGAGTRLRRWIGSLAGLRPRRARLALALLPAIALLIAGACAMGYYFWRVTGSPFRLPVIVNRATYAIAPYFIWGTPAAFPTYRSREMLRYYQDFELAEFNNLTSFPGFITGTLDKLGRLWAFYLGPTLTLPLLLLPRMLRDQRIRFLLWMALMMVCTIVFELWTFPHYVAAYTGVILALVLQGLRHFRAAGRAAVVRRRRAARTTAAAIGRRGALPPAALLPGPRLRRFQLCLARALPLVCLVVLAVRLIARPGEPRSEFSWCCVGPGNTARTQLQTYLEKQPGSHLVFVHYSPQHNPHNEWVYNRADIDNSRVVWARELDDEQNRRLTDYYRGRHVWLVEPDKNPVPLSALNLGK